MSTPVQTRER